MQKQKEKSVSYGGGSDFDDRLEITHEVQALSIDEILRAAKAAISLAQVTIANQEGGSCGCFGDD